MKKALEEPQGGVEEAMKPVNLAPSAPLVTMSQHCDVVVGGAEQGPGIKVAASFMGPGINVAASFILTGKKTDKITNEDLRKFASTTYNVDLQRLKDAITLYDVHSVVKDFRSGQRGLSGIVFRHPPGPAFPAGSAEHDV